MKKILLSIVSLCVVGGAIAQSNTKHPNFIFSNDEVKLMQQKSTSQTWLSDLKDVVVSDADKMMNIGVKPYMLIDESESIYKGVQGRAAQVRILNLALAGVLTGDEAYSKKAKDILLAIVRQTVPSNPEHWNTHLQAGDAAQAVTLGYDVLYNYMTEKERKEVRKEIEQFGEYLYAHAGSWDSFDTMPSSCNHNSVHHGALGLCALVLGDKPAWLHKAIMRTEAFFECCSDDDGYVTEGHHYLSYGFAGAIPFAYALKRVEGLDLIEKYKDVIANTGDQVLWNILPDGDLSVLNDSYAAPMGEMAVFGGLLYNRPEQLWAWLEVAKDKPLERDLNMCEKRCRYYAGYHEKKDGVYVSSPMGLPYTRCYMFLPDAKYTNVVSPKDSNYELSKYFESGRVFMRSGWGSEDDAHASFTSGRDYHHGHNQQDENSITFYALGKLFLYDAAYWPKYSYCHSTLKIDGQEQWIPHGRGSHTVGQVQKYREDGYGTFVRGEARGAYQADKGIASSNRKMLFVRETPASPYIIIRDDAYMANRSEVEFETRFITKPDYTIVEKGNGVVISTDSDAKALVLAFSGTTPIKFNENDVSGETFFAHVNGGDFTCADYFKRISAKVTAQNPRFTTIVLPYRTESELPAVSVGEYGDDIVYTLKFKSGEVQTIVASVDNIVLK